MTLNTTFQTTALLSALALWPTVGGCSKSRADEFSKFRAAESVQGVGAAPRVQLRYRPIAGEDVVYRLTVDRRCPALGQKSKMRLRAALRVQTVTGGGGSFVLRLVNIQRLDPPPPGGLSDLGPALVLLQGRLGPRGLLSELQDTEKLPSPVNLVLALPLLLPRLPQGAVGIGARWRTADKVRWRRTRSADPLTHQPGYRGTTDVLLKRAYHLSGRDASKRPILVGELSFKLKSHTRTLSHTVRQRGDGKATARYVLDPQSGVPVKAKVSLTGSYALRADDKRSKVTETLTLTLTKE